MKRLSFDPRDVIGGLVLIAIGVAAIVIAGEYPFGTARRMGPGYFPVILGGICAILGVAIVAKGFIRRMWDDGTIQMPALRNVIGVIAAISAFILTGEHFGLVPATLLLVGIGAVIDRGNSWLTVVLLSLAVMVGGVALFSYGLGITFPLFGR
jgi:uncharacterized protein YybS (DUF2232 family)